MNIPEIILSCILICGGAVYLTACLAAFRGHFVPLRISAGSVPTVSVIIAARNEEENIGNVLEDLLGQDYPEDKLRVFVIDDCSEDGTGDVVKAFIARDNRISLRAADHSNSPYTHKKKAIHEGIISSDGEIIMTVDADCRVRRSWVGKMVEFFVPGVDLVAGVILVDGGGLMGWLETLEFTGIQMMSAGLMNARFPITCNGANLAYRRSAFERTGGFDGIGRVVSGDDDMLMQKIARGQPSSVVCATGPETAVHVKAKHTLREFFVQRIRWASKIATYPSRPAVALLAVFFVFFTTIMLWPVLVLFGNYGLLTFIAGYGLKTAGDLLLCGYGVISHRRPGLLLLFPLAEVLHVPYIIYVTLRGLFGSFDWRGRRINKRQK